MAIQVNSRPEDVMVCSKGIIRRSNGKEGCRAEMKALSVERVQRNITIVKIPSSVISGTRPKWDDRGRDNVSNIYVRRGD